jgi:hypothetical protein
LTLIKSNKNYYFIFLAVFFLQIGRYEAQTLDLKNHDERKEWIKDCLNIIGEDTYLFFGTNYSTLYHSNFFRQSKPNFGGSLGLIGYSPLTGKAYLNIGLQAQLWRKEFQFIGNNSVNSLTSIGVPLYLSYDLPSPSRSQIKLQLGVQTDYILFTRHTNQSQSPPFDWNKINRLHLQYRLGFQYEWSPFLLEAYWAVGVNKLYKNEIGVPAQIALQVGYFFKRNKKHKELCGFVF